MNRYLHRVSNIKILIIEDEIIIAQDIEAMILDLGYESVGIISNSTRAIDYLSFNTPDIVLCDINIKGPKDGIEVATTIRAKKKIPFIFLTSLSDRGTIERAKAALPYGYIVKPFDQRDLLSNIEIALFKFGQELEQLRITPEKINSIAIEPLTSQEYKVLDKMIAGVNNNNIADHLHISKNTLKYHIKNLFVKLEVSNRAEALHKLIKLLTI